MLASYPKGLKVPIFAHLQVQRSFIRNWYALLIGGSFLFCLYQVQSVYNPYRGVSSRIFYRSQPDYVNSQIVLQSQVRPNTLTDF